MSYTIHQLKEKAIPLPITQVALMVAGMFASEQPTPSKKRQVYLNTLAVYIVNNYMEMMHISTNLKQGDSWHPSIRLCADVSDLKLTELGHLECRPISPVSLTEPATVLCALPEEMPDDRIGCIVVEINEERREANLLGFAKTVSSGELLSIAQLLHMDEFREYLEDLSISNKSMEPPKKLVNLSQWLQNIVESGWQPPNNLLRKKSDNLALGVRSAPAEALSSRVKQAKLIEFRSELLESQLIPQSVVLVIVVIPLNKTAQIRIKVEIYPISVQTYLPAQLQISILDASREVVMTGKTKSENEDLRFRFRGEPGERFSVKLTLGDVDVIENFLI